MSDDVRDWLVTVPKTIKWEDYQKELDAAEEGDILNYRTRFIPKGVSIGDRLYIVWNGRIRGFMFITGLKRDGEPFICKTTGKTWPAGNYIQRSGKFYHMIGVEKRGFQGIREITGLFI